MSYLGLEKEAVLGIILMLEEEYQITELTDFLAENSKATQSDIFKQAVIINGNDD